MGRELQKKKNRSSRAKVQRHHKSKKLMLRNPIIAANWDKKKTLSQNYKALGLTSRLNAPTGGVEKRHTSPDPDSEFEGFDTLAIHSSTKPGTIEGEVPEFEVERDPETGAIIRVITGGEESANTSAVRANPLKDPLNDLDHPDTDRQMQDWLTLGHVPAKSNGRKKQDTQVVAALEAIAARGTRSKPHTQSEGEKDWVQRLVKRHGNDYEAMFRDRRLNVMQQSVGDIKRRVLKWKKTQKLA